MWETLAPYFLVSGCACVFLVLSNKFQSLYKKLQSCWAVLDTLGWFFLLWFPPYAYQHSSYFFTLAQNLFTSFIVDPLASWSRSPLPLSWSRNSDTTEWSSPVAFVVVVAAEFVLLGILIYLLPGTKHITHDLSAPAHQPGALLGSK